ncbi:carboxylating nicotinate-nucleotide diphosphorylase [Alkalilimnicola ehrlichii MLHE-1]|uniref:Probable nicotinate-nucleotide pyrophosphorylase [carboxylating] n=1 Tax=Alkalilimnicola ehrlichii (strain ATCC BAA-1101 / DSM 17681 / MLHE-1) TaxID=187272 RepID=Q0A6U8_ALKEH|nr:carboxylating nicotinate-nucleotide diphosphorylase [Alkalilimnicola ehrlichii]ABI57439.1 nicotinate-nucleotide pyrophosphorylase (carboxylating) [Alkalilimnicola ehrlichii MLHE-1]
MCPTNVRPQPPAAEQIQADVTRALEEDLGTGDVTAELVPRNAWAQGQVICREQAVLCGHHWFDEVFRQLDDRVEIHWAAGEGQRLTPDQPVCTFAGPARALLSGERTALNFLQTLSATATQARHFVDLVAGTHARILDTRKTLPGLRAAQKYATRCGGALNHRQGLYDAILIKENHILACGSIAAAVAAARERAPELPVEVEVETLQELEQALAAEADTIMLDNFSLADVERAVALTARRSKLEASGNLGEQGLRELAGTGVDYISIGAITKHVRAVDYSLRLRL